MQRPDHAQLARRRFDHRQAQNFTGAGLALAQQLRHQPQSSYAGVQRGNSDK
jgi:hypothetical protein